MRNQQSLTTWMDRLPDLRDLKRQRLSDDEIIQKALRGEANLEPDEVRELSYKSAGRGQFFTPKPVAELVAFLADIQQGETVLDPACGLGNLMDSALAFTKKVHGIELMSETAQLASVALGLSVKQGNALEMLNSIKPYDVVILNPPFGTIKPYTINNWDSFALNEKKNSNKLEVLFLELSLRIAKRRVVMIAPHSLLSNPGQQYVRKWILENFGYRASISLPRKAFWESTRNRNKWRTPATTTATSIMVIDKTKPEEDYKVFMVTTNSFDDLIYVEQFWSKFTLRFSSNRKRLDKFE